MIFLIDIDNVDMGNGLFMPFYFSYPYRFNYDFLKKFFYPFGFSRSFKTTAMGIGKAFSESAGSFDLSVFSAQAQPDFFTKGSTADFERALDNVNWEVQNSAYERYFTNIGKNFSQSNKISDILKTNDYKKSYLYSNREAFEKNIAENFAKVLYKSDFISLIESKNTKFSNQLTPIEEFTNGLIQIAEFTNGLTQITDFSNTPKAANPVYSGQLKIVNSVLQSQSENPAFLKAYKSKLSTINALEKSLKFSIAGGFSKSEHVNIFPNFKAENTPYKSTENFAAKAAENQSGILKNLSLQEQNFYLYRKNGNIPFQSLENRTEKFSELFPPKFSPKSSEKSLVSGEQIPFQKPCQATPEINLTSAGIDFDSLLDMICSALEEELNTCAEGVHL